MSSLFATWMPDMALVALIADVASISPDSPVRIQRLDNTGWIAVRGCSSMPVPALGSIAVGDLEAPLYPGIVTVATYRLQSYNPVLDLWIDQGGATITLDIPRKDDHGCWLKRPAMTYASIHADIVNVGDVTRMPISTLSEVPNRGVLTTEFGMAADQFELTIRLEDSRHLEQFDRFCKVNGPILIQSLDGELINPNNSWWAITNITMSRMVQIRDTGDRHVRLALVAAQRPAGPYPAPPGLTTWADLANTTWAQLAGLTWEQVLFERGRFV
jgi:hypothetical protein